VNTEADFRAQVKTKAWPALMQHGVGPTGCWDYQVVRVWWRAAEEPVEYRFDGELDGQIGRNGRERSAKAKADQLLSAHASGREITC